MKTGKDVQVGDEVFVLYRTGYRETAWVPAKVAKASRVWLEIERTDGLFRLRQAWRMRRDTQNEGENGIYQARFVTLEQKQVEDEINAADAFLREQGIDILARSDWRSPSRRIALANWIRVLAEELAKSAGGVR